MYAQVGTDISKKEIWFIANIFKNLLCVWISWRAYQVQAKIHLGYSETNA